MRRLFSSVVLSVTLASLLSLAPTVASAATTQLPPETKGDPKPDTDQRWASEARPLRGRDPAGEAGARSRRALRRGDAGAGQGLLLREEIRALDQHHRYRQSIDANNAECYNLLGFIALSHDDRISATAAFRKATELNPLYGNAWDNLAAQYLFSKNYDGALQAAERATELTPSFDKAWLNLGSAYRGKQQYSDALAAYRRRCRSIRATPTPTSTSAFSISTPSRCRIPIRSRSSIRRSILRSVQDEAWLSADEGRSGGRLYRARRAPAPDREKKRLERLQKQQQRGEPKAAPSAATARSQAGEPGGPAERKDRGQMKRVSIVFGVRRRGAAGHARAAFAQDAARAQRPRSRSSARPRTEDLPHHRGHRRRGKIQKPNACYVLQRSGWITIGRA